MSIRYFLDWDSMTEPEKAIAGSSEQMLDRLGQLGDIGVSHVLLDTVARGGTQGKIDAITRFAEEVMPNV